MGKKLPLDFLSRLRQCHLDGHDVGSGPAGAEKRPGFEQKRQHPSHNGGSWACPCDRDVVSAWTSGDEPNSWSDKFRLQVGGRTVDARTDGRE